MWDSAALDSWRSRARGIDQRPSLRPRWRAIVAAAGLVVAMAYVGLGSGARNGARTAAQPPVTVGRPPCPAVATALQDSSAMHADVDGDGCDEEVSFADGVLTAGALHMRVGAPGDQIALGRWTCGPETVAVLRPETGEVFRFDGWATQGRSLPAMPLGRVQGAVGVEAKPRASGRCDDVAVSRNAGPPVLLPERPVAG